MTNWKYPNLHWTRSPLHRFAYYVACLFVGTLGTIVLGLLRGFPIVEYAEAEGVAFWLSHRVVANPLGLLGTWLAAEAWIRHRLARGRSIDRLWKVGKVPLRFWPLRAAALAVGVPFSMQVAVWFGYTEW